MPTVAKVIDVPPAWMLYGIGAMVGLHLWLPGGWWLDLPWRRVGWLLVGIACVLMVSSMRRFLRVGTGLRPFAPVTTLVVSGAYRWTRNPMYLGMVVAMFGIAVLLGSLSPLAVPPLLLLLLDRRFVAREEVFLRQHLGAPYEEYCRQVRRWL